MKKQYLSTNLNQFLNENKKGDNYTVWLVDYTDRKNWEKKKSYYYDFPKIFEGDEDSFNEFMKKNYPNAQKINGLFGNKEETEQFKKFNKLRDSEGYPTIPYLQLHIGGFKNFSGYLVQYLLKPLK